MEQQSIIRRIGRGIAAFLPHLLMTYAWMLLTFYVINLLNDSMGFLNSKVSRHFETIYIVVTLLTAGISFAQKHLRIPAVITAAAAIVFAVPVVNALVQNSPLPLDTAFFRMLSLIFSLVTLAFSIALITLQRIAAKKRYHVQTEQKTE